MFVIGFTPFKLQLDPTHVGPLQLLQVNVPTYLPSPQTESACEMAVILGGDPTNYMARRSPVKDAGTSFNENLPKVKPFFIFSKIIRNLLIYLGFAKHRSGFWHALTP